MQPTYNKSKIRCNAWYMMGGKLVNTFGAALRKAWRDEKWTIIVAKVEGRTTTESRHYNRPKGVDFTAVCVLKAVPTILETAAKKVAVFCF